MTPEAPHIAKLRDKLPKASPTRALKAVRELVTEPVMSREILELAADFAKVAEPSTDKLLRLWPKATDVDGFAEHLLAPAFVREGRDTLRLSKVSSLTGLRHVTALRDLTFDRCKTLTDLSDLSGLTNLERLDLEGCALLTDLAPLSGLTELRSLDLRRCGQVDDVSPLLTLRKLQRLDLTRTAVASLDGFGDSFPDLESLTLDECRSVRDIGPLSGLRKLKELNLDNTGAEDLTGLRDLDSVEVLSLRSKRLTSLDGIDVMPALEKLWLEGSGVKSLDGLGHHPRITMLGLPNRQLPDLRPLSRLPALTELWINKYQQLKSLTGLEGHPALSQVDIFFATDITDFSALAQMPVLRGLKLHSLDQLTDLTPVSGLEHVEELHLSACGMRSFGAVDLPALRKLLVFDCVSLVDLGTLVGAPALAEVRFYRCTALAPGVVADLEARGIAVKVY